MDPKCHHKYLYRRKVWGNLVHSGKSDGMPGAETAGVPGAETAVVPGAGEV